MQLPRSCLWVSQDDQAKLGTSEGYIEPARVAEEADALVLIGAHTRKNDVILLAALEGVHTADLHLHERPACHSHVYPMCPRSGPQSNVCSKGHRSARVLWRSMITHKWQCIVGCFLAWRKAAAHLSVEGGCKGAGALHSGEDVGALPFVGGDYADLLRLHARPHEVRHYFLHRRRLCAAHRRVTAWQHGLMFMPKYVPLTAPALWASYGKGPDVQPAVSNVCLSLHAGSFCKRKEFQVAKGIAEKIGQG